MPSLHAGELLARRYRLIDRIGAGGMSVIWRARDEVLGRMVAVKVLATELAADPRFRAMVRDEARAAAQLVHPHVTAVHDYGEAFAVDGEVTAFVVMELLAGEELERRLTAGPLPWAEAVEICAQVAEALAAAHRLGIVHRDITPANIMLTATGVKVLDFGIATRIGAPDTDEEGDTFGTPAYVAPERLDGKPAQPATDTYSLGVLLYETLTGRPPYPADTWEELTGALREPAPALTGVPGLPPAVAEVCHRCLRPDPAGRPTAHRVGVALREQLRAVAPSEQRTHRGRRAAGLVAATVLALAAVLLAGSTLDQRRRSAESLPDPATSGPPAPTVTEDATAAVDPRAALAELARLVDAGVSAGEIRPDAGTDLHNLLRALPAGPAAGPADLTGPVAQLRAKVAVRVTEGAITIGYADRLDAALARLPQVAPSGRVP
ncbi:serine/threonine protein kinase [Micromonospora pattaloongensis]|uniref:non-specific serine/threonine protein kinase n=1 Tax=Micromonospora pattaloongensis TaxID=405436 RepID=A0A1H3G061_9ACTN|nr:serine/threonine-protein kinase [Micromonospora pattaloongensis]SDX95739.1 serine/threonine protein kinase [Micromonospora pattaloongensis]